MHRIVLVGVGERKVHLLRIVGALVIFGSALGVLDKIAQILRLMIQLHAARADPFFSLYVFGLKTSALTNEVMLGFFMEPIAFLFLWLALFCIGVMIYKSGEIVIPISTKKTKT